MKKFKSISSLFALTALFSMVLIVGCQKDAIEVDPIQGDMGKVEDNILIMSPDGFQQVGMDELQNLFGESYSSERNSANGNGNGNGNSGNSQVNSHFSVQPGGVFVEGTFQLNVVENNQGLSGSGTGSVIQDIGGVIYEYKLIVKPACLSSNGEEAVTTGEITQIIGIAPSLITVGKFVSIKVIDNGQGEYAPADQYNPIIIIHDFCGSFPLGHPLWTFQPDQDVLKASDYVTIR